MPSRLFSATGFSNATSRAPLSMAMRIISTAQVGKSAKTENVGPDAQGDLERVPAFYATELGCRCIQTRRVDVADARHLEPVVGLEREGMVHSALAHAHYDDSVFVVHRALPIPLEDLVHRVVHFLFGQLGEHGQRNAARRVAFRVGDWSNDARLMAPGISVLLMDRNRIMALGVDAFFVQEL